MSKTMMELVGESLYEAGVRIVGGKLVVPTAQNVDPAIADLKGAVSIDFNTLAKIETEIKKNQTAITTAKNDLTGGASDDYNTFKKVEDAIGGLISTMSTDTERLDAIKEVINAFEGADDFIKGLVNGKLGKEDTAVNSTKLENLTLDEVLTKAVEKYEVDKQGTKDDFVNALKE